MESQEGEEDGDVPAVLVMVAGELVAGIKAVVEDQAGDVFVLFGGVLDRFAAGRGDDLAVEKVEGELEVLGDARGSV